MVFSKKVWITLGACLTTSAVVIGTATGVGISNSNSHMTSNTESNTAISSGDEIHKKPATKPEDETNKQNEKENELLGDDPYTSETISEDENTNFQSPKQESIDIEKAVKELNKESIILKDLTTSDSATETKEVSKNSVFAFRVRNNQLGLKGIKLPKQTKVTFDLSSSNNTATNLNDGKLFLKVKLEANSKVATSEEIAIEGFKKAELDQTLKPLFENDGSGLIIKIDPKKDGLTEQFSTIEQLNNLDISSSLTGIRFRNNPVSKLNGLTSWLRKDEMKQDKISSTNLSGEVKLEKITTDDSTQKTYFHLVATNTKNTLVLSNGDKEIAINEIKTTNLLATDVSVVAKGFDSTKTNQFLEKLKITTDAEAKANSIDQTKHYVTEFNDTNTNKQLAVNLETEESKNLLFINPYVVSKNGTENVELPIYISVTYGKGNNAISFKTSDMSQLEILKKAGFSFGLYAKVLDDVLDTQEIKPSIFISKKADLTKYFTLEHYTKPLSRLEKNSGEGMDKYPAGFDLVTFENSSLTTDLKINLGSDMHVDKSENLLLFADYSYKPVGSNMVLFSPFISLIHLQKQQSQ